MTDTVKGGPSQRVWPATPMEAAEEAIILAMDHLAARRMGFAPYSGEDTHRLEAVCALADALPRADTRTRLQSLSKARRELIELNAAGELTHDQRMRVLQGAWLIQRAIDALNNRVECSGAVQPPWGSTEGRT